MDDNSVWVSWAEAARITGLPVHVVEWWKRQGRIEHRAEDKRRCTLRRSSVEEFGLWYRAREAERVARSEARLAARRAARGSRTPPRPVGFVTLPEAAVSVGRSNKTVLRRARPLGAVLAGDRWWIPCEAVEEIVRQLRVEADQATSEASRWVSLREAARIIGCDDSTVLAYVKRGAIEHQSASPLGRTAVSSSLPWWSAKPEGA